MNCPNCAAENVSGAKFCNECGTALAAGCPNCGAANPPGARFCNECGTSLAGRAEASAAAPAGARRPGAGPAGALPTVGMPVAERRLVTVLFADLVGFTPFAEERDAEDVRDTLSRYFELASEVVGRYGGTVEKFIGDAVMAVWGAPTAHEDDAERAVRAGLELISAVPALGEGISARAGVLTGEAAVTLGATNQGMVAGDLVNTASRLQSVAAEGTVLVGESTFRAASAAIAFEPAGEHLLKGKQSPVPAWCALRVIAERGGRNRAEALEAPFVGRDDELRLLKELFHSTGRERRIRLVSVMGPAGIGKSRLASEFSKYVDGLVEPVYWHAGRSPAYGEGITFWALGEMVRSRCGLLETDDEATTRQKVSEAVRQWVPDGADQRWIEPALLTLLGVESGASPDELFTAWRTFFERIALAGTVVLVFEELHFADSGLLDFVDHLLDWSRGLPLFVVTLARPELLDRRPDWGAGKRNFVSIYLEPLPRDEMRQLLAGLVPGLPEEAMRTIVARADGVPLYAVETVRMLVTGGQLRPEGDSYTPVGDLSRVAIPESLTALIAARLDALEPADRSLVQDAAVLGQSFSVAALAAVSRTAQDELEPRLAGLVRRELLSLRADPRSPEHGQYAFVQALVREVAYNTLSRRERKARHLAAARHFESLGTEELAGALAGHYLAARANAGEGAEAEAVAAQARIALRAAADRAASLGAYQQALAFLEQALTVTDEPADQADLLERAGVAAKTAALYESANDVLRRALELRRQLGDRLGAARVTARLGEALLDGHRDHAALELLLGASDEFGDLAPDPVVSSIDAELSRALIESDRQRALDVAERVLESAERRNLVGPACRALIVKGAVLGGLGRKREGIALVEAAAKLAGENGLTDILLSSLIVAGYIQMDLDMSAALGSFRDGLALARRLGHRHRLQVLINNFGYSAFLAGDWDGAILELEGALAEEVDDRPRIQLLSNALVVRAARGEDVSAGIAELERLGSAQSEKLWRINLFDAEANAALADGRLDDAREAWRNIIEVDPPQAPEFIYRAARPAIWNRDLATLRSALDELDATGVHGRVMDARRLTLLAALAALEGRAAEATRMYREALAAWRDQGLAWDEGLTGIDMATVLDPAEPEVARMVSATLEILMRLGARPFVERLDSLAGERRGTGSTTPGAQMSAETADPSPATGPPVTVSD